MTDSPSFPIALDPKEQHILDRLLATRDKLSLLKQDRSTYIKSHDVLDLYEQVIEQVHLLNIIREEHDKPLEQNRVDNVLDDCFQLISLFFLTIGRNNEAPAVYSMTSTIRRLLDHLKEAAFYSPKDLESAGQALDSMQETLKRGEESHSPHLLKLLRNRLNTCRQLLSDLQLSLADLSLELTPTYERLVSILRSISAANTRQKFPSGEVQGFQDQLREIQATMVDGKFLVENKTTPAGQNVATELLNRCLKWSEIVLERQGEIDERFKPTYEKLCSIRSHLEKLSITQAWSLRETDLYDYQRQLDRIDESRVNGNFEDAFGNKADLHAQRTLLYLIRRSYAYIYTLIISSEPVSEALLPVFNQLQTLRRCLLEVKRSGGVSSTRELYPYSMKLNSIDNMRVDGKFMVGADIPEGQGSVNSLLAECFDLNYELRIEAEDNDSSES
ncbi:MAG: hypothetical protein L6R38_002541 [Xanthoria sp. 2 TBL-2021]|nr:MAG: hypothetical protein L6R38_002541 [Xanthoria sp. 2 TBL-2021]